MSRCVVRRTEELAYVVRAKTYGGRSKRQFGLVSLVSLDLQF